MLFSREDVAGFINARFEPVWESVRPVPILRLDFGTGHVITRTLHGNIATYVCTHDGHVLDVLPGIYTPPVYLAQLGQLRLLYDHVSQAGADQRATRLRDWHRQCLEARRKSEQTPQLLALSLDFTKAKIERSKQVLVMARTGIPAAPPAEEEGSPAASGEDLAGWKLLVADTRLNEQARRLAINERLSRDGLTQPARMTKWLYKEVLHADLDDPYLGLGKVLFDGYVFDKEDRP